MSSRSNRKPAPGQRSSLIKYMTSTSYKLEPAIRSRRTGQRMTWFERCQLIITWCHISKKYKVNQGCMWACLCQPIIWRMAAILLDSTIVVAAVVRTRPRAILLALITTRKSIHENQFLYGYGAPLAGPPELRYKLIFSWLLHDWENRSFTIYRYCKLHYSDGQLTPVGPWLYLHLKEKFQF